MEAPMCIKVVLKGDNGHQREMGEAGGGSGEWEWRMGGARPEIFVLFFSAPFQFSSHGHSIIFLLLSNNQPQTSWLKTTPTYYLTVSEGQESGYGSSGLCSGCHRAAVNLLVRLCSHQRLNWAKVHFPAPSGFWQNLFLKLWSSGCLCL